MLPERTTFIIGAAVSNEVGLPLGWDLKAKICELLPHQSAGNDYVRDALYTGRDLNLAGKAVEAIRAALPKAASIDNLIEHRGADQVFKHCAKVGIVAAILNGERTSDLYTPPGSRTGSIDAESSSYAAIFRLIVGNVSRERIEEAFDRVSFINFNYDRCLEHYLYDWLSGYSGLEPASAARIVAKLEVVRPYGSVGPLPIGAPPTQTGVVPFGSELYRVNLNEIAENILTFSEERQSQTDHHLKRITGSSNQIIFLGCAYHSQNLRILEPDTAVFKRAYGTCYNVPPKDPKNFSVPHISEFSAPTADAFERALRRWRYLLGATGGRVIKFEAHTSAQFIAKYGAEWCDLE